MSATVEPTPEPLRPPAWDSLKREVDGRLYHLAEDVAKVRSELLQAIEEEKQNEILVAIRNLSNKVTSLDAKVTDLAEKVEEDR